jgi:hypothetical protein
MARRPLAAKKIDAPAPSVESVEEHEESPAPSDVPPTTETAFKYVINERWKIEADAYNFTLFSFRASGNRLGKTRKNVEAWDIRGYYPKLEQACMAALNKMVAEGEGVSTGNLSEVIKLIRSCSEQIVKAVKENTEAS